MRIVCRRDGLLPAFQLASAATAARDHKPVLQNVKAKASLDQCTLQATNLELGIRLEFNSTAIQEPGEVLLPAARTLAILREAPDEELTVEAKDDVCRVRGQSSEFELCTEDANHFPDVPAFSADKHYEINAGMLREMIRRTLFAVAAENTRYALTGILWELDGESACLVGTDGRRLAVAHGTAVYHGGHETKGQPRVVPAKAMHLLERNLHDPDEQVCVNLTANEALFRTNQVTI